MARNTDNCNLALISILDLDGDYTWVVDNFRRITELEYDPLKGISSQSVFGKCVCLTGPHATLGGFRQVRQSNLSHFSEEENAQD